MTYNVDFCDKVHVSGSNNSKYDENKILRAPNMAEIQYGRHFSLKYPKCSIEKICKKSYLCIGLIFLPCIVCMYAEMPAGFQDHA